MGKKFTVHVNVFRDPSNYETFAPGDDVPDWALDHVGDHTYTDQDEFDVRLTDPHYEDDDPAVKFATPTTLPPVVGGVSSNETDSDEEVDYTELKKDELIALAEERGLDSSGTKADIIERLEADDEADEEE